MIKKIDVGEVLREVRVLITEVVGKGYNLTDQVVEDVEAILDKATIESKQETGMYFQCGKCNRTSFDKPEHFINCPIEPKEEPESPKEHDHSKTEFCTIRWDIELQQEILEQLMSRVEKMEKDYLESREK